MPDTDYDALVDGWAARPSASEHALLEAEHAVRAGHRPGDAPTLGPHESVPGCRCPRCILLVDVREGSLTPAAFDVIVGQVLPELAAVVPDERVAAASNICAAWAACGANLPDPGRLARLAARVPGAIRTIPARSDMAPLPVEQARRADILGVADSLGLVLDRLGRSYRGPCPIHDGHDPNFSVDPARGRYKCFSCGATGDGIDLVQSVLGVDFPAAVRFITDSARRLAS